MNEVPGSWISAHKEALPDTESCVTIEQVIIEHTEWLVGGGWMR